MLASSWSGFWGWNLFLSQLFFFFNICSSQENALHQVFCYYWLKELNSLSILMPFSKGLPVFLCYGVILLWLGVGGWEEGSSLNLPDMLFCFTFDNFSYQLSTLCPFHWLTCLNILSSFFTFLARCLLRVLTRISRWWCFCLFFKSLSREDISHRLPSSSYLLGTEPFHV